MSLLIAAAAVTAAIAGITVVVAIAATVAIVAATAMTDIVDESAGGSQDNIRFETDRLQIDGSFRRDASPRHKYVGICSSFCKPLSVMFVFVCNSDFQQVYFVGVLRLDRLGSSYRRSLSPPCARIVLVRDM